MNTCSLKRRAMEKRYFLPIIAFYVIQEGWIFIDTGN